MKLKSLFCLCLALPLMAAANNEAQQPPQNIVSFSAETEKEVPRDLMQVSLYLHEEGNNLKNLNKTIAEKLNKGLTRIKQQPTVEIQSNSRQTQVRYNNKNQKDGWIATAELVLQSKDFSQLSQLIEDLSPLFAIGNIEAALSKEAVAAMEDEMTDSVLAKFQAKATLIQHSLQAKGYRLLDINIDSLNEHYASPMVNHVAMKMAVAEQAAPVQPESGKTRLKAIARGRIELIKE